MIVSLAVQATMILVVGVIGGLFGAWLQELFGGMYTKEFFRLLGLRRSSEKACGVEEDPGNYRFRLMIDYYAAGARGSLLMGEELEAEEIVDRARTAMRAQGYEERFDRDGVPTWAPPQVNAYVNRTRRSR